MMRISHTGKNEEIMRMMRDRLLHGGECLIVYPDRTVSLDVNREAKTACATTAIHRPDGSLEVTEISSIRIT